MLRSRFDNYADALGPPEHRYYGSGYKRVSRYLTDLSVARSSLPGSTSTAVARLIWSEDWTARNYAGLVPRVSAVDALIIAAALCEAVIVRARDLTETEASTIWLRRVLIRSSGLCPADTKRIRVRVVLLNVVEGDLEVESTYLFRVGPLTGALTLAHPPGAVWISFQGSEVIDEFYSIYGLPGRHHYLEGLTSHELTATSLVVDETQARVTATQQISAATAATPYVGAESKYADSVSFVDGIVGGAQLAQILLNHVGGGGVSENHFRLRKLEIVADTPARSATDEFAGVAELSRRKVFDRDGRRWLSAAVGITEFGGLTGSVSCTRPLAS
ncbi:hypothetical protein F3087_40160 [Nocardia colli]|uniref:Avirulence D protein (AvrD) n=1 Tax=Nocardia colli TaxID=2545717 RepID=A0A5N0DYW2_9NOCA|nr:AvrD family protein [Nocardia colli]KAA8881886.1 hypothetical protein F3087_40160 [Nocardia colli]